VLSKLPLKSSKKAKGHRKKKMLKTIKQLEKLSRLPSHQNHQFSRVLRTLDARFYNTMDKTPQPEKELSSTKQATPEGAPQYTDVPIPKKSPVAPPTEPEVPKIDRSRPLPPPAYAASRLDQVKGIEDQELKFDHSGNQLFEEEPKGPDDLRTANQELNSMDKETKTSHRPEYQFDHRFNSGKLAHDERDQRK